MDFVRQKRTHEAVGQIERDVDQHEKSTFRNIITGNKRIKKIEKNCVVLPVYLLITWIKSLIV